MSLLGELSLNLLRFWLWFVQQTPSSSSFGVIASSPIEHFERRSSETPGSFRVLIADSVERLHVFFFSLGFIEAESKSVAMPKAWEARQR